MIEFNTLEKYSTLKNSIMSLEKMINICFLFLSLFLLSTRAFIPTTPKLSFHQKTFKFELAAESGPPKYDKINGILLEREELAPGSIMLHIGVDDETTKLDYKPGHVIALEIQDGSNPDDKWLPGPYTITRSTENSVDILMKVVGKKSEIYANCEKNTPIKFGGKFKVPILDGISKEESVKKVVFISTGVGVGPMVGAIESALEEGTCPPIELFALYRTSSDVIYKEFLDKLSKNNDSSAFQWNTIISSDESGRISSESNLQKVFDNNNSGLDDTHYHLIGNGQMVKEWQAGLLNAGIPESMVTIEQYFNHKVEGDSDVVDRISKAVTDSCAVVV